MKKLTTAILSVFFVIAIGSPVEAAKSCSKIGSISGTQAKPLVCKLVKGKRVWQAKQVVTNKRTPGPLFKATTGTYLGSSIGISVSWGFPYDVGSSPVTGYRLEYMMANTPWTFMTNLPPNQYFQNVNDGRPANNLFRFRVAAINAHGLGVFSESDWVLYGVTTTSTGSTTTTVAVSQPTTTPTTTTTTVSGPTETAGQYNARRSAASYLRIMAFSRSGLIKQLEYEKFSLDDATYGVDAQNADWNTQASKSAASYLKLMAFSRSGLISQLVYEGFSQSQAEYGVNSVGL
jgi:hypothetical protein